MEGRMNEKMIGTLRQMERGIIDDAHEVVATGRLTEAEAATVQWLWEEWGTTEL